jgi:hypothetical protein
MKELPDKEKRKAWVITQLALKSPMTKIKQDYHVLFEEPIRGEEIIAIQSSYPSLIQQVADKELRDIRKRALAHQAIRLDIIEQGLRAALTPRVISTHRIADNEWKEEIDINHSAATKWVELAQKEEFFTKKLILEMYKADMGFEKSSGFERVDIADGFLEVDNASSNS